LVKCGLLQTVDARYDTLRTETSFFIYSFGDNSVKIYKPANNLRFEMMMDQKVQL